MQDDWRATEPVDRGPEASSSALIVIYLTTEQEREAREMQHRRHMAALEKGIDIPLAGIGTTRRPTNPLDRALLILASRIALWVPA